MTRPKIPRRICGVPADSCFKPSAQPMSQLHKIKLADDEFEAMRLVDLLGMQQQQAALQMGVSRQTLANILKAARYKVMDCLINGKALLLDKETGELSHDYRNSNE